MGACYSAWYGAWCTSQHAGTYAISGGNSEAALHINFVVHKTKLIINMNDDGNANLLSRLVESKFGGFELYFYICGNENAQTYD